MTGKVHRIKYRRSYDPSKRGVRAECSCQWMSRYGTRAAAEAAAARHLASVK